MVILVHAINIGLDMDININNVKSLGISAVCFS